LLESEPCAHGDAAQAFFDPVFRVAFLFVDGSHAFGGEFGVFDFLKALVADFGKPELGGFCLGRRDGLDEAHELLGVSDIRHALLSVVGVHFQPVTTCNGFVSFIFKKLLHHPPIDLGIGTLGQDGDNIDDGEHPFFLVGVPSATDFFFE